jgi:hypothetical protein
MALYQTDWVLLTFHASLSRSKSHIKMLHCYTVWANYTEKRMAYQNNIKTDVETNMDRRQAALIMLHSSFWSFFVTWAAISFSGRSRLQLRQRWFQKYGIWICQKPCYDIESRSGRIKTARHEHAHTHTHTGNYRNFDHINGKGKVHPRTVHKSPEGE